MLNFSYLLLVASGKYGIESGEWGLFFNSDWFWRNGLCLWPLWLWNRYELKNPESKYDSSQITFLKWKYEYYLCFSGSLLSSKFRKGRTGIKIFQLVSTKGFQTRRTVLLLLEEWLWKQFCKENQEKPNRNPRSSAALSLWSLYFLCLQVPGPTITWRRHERKSA